MIYKVATVIYNGPVKMLDQKNGEKKERKWLYTSLDLLVNLLTSVHMCACVRWFWAQTEFQ